MPPKKMTRLQIVEAELADLRGQFSAVVQREMDISAALGRHPGEYPVACAKRAAQERSTLADKVLAKTSELTAVYSKNSDLVRETTRMRLELRAQADVLCAIGSSLRASAS